MRRKTVVFLLTMAVLSLAAACSRQQAAPSVREAVSKSLEQAGYDHVRVDEDQNKGVITLNGKVRSDELKARASEVARQAAPGKIVSNQLSIEPVDQEVKARKIESNVNDAIDKDYKAALIANHLDGAGIRYDVKNGVITLNGSVKDADTRAQAEKVAASVPNVQQVVNKLDVKGR